MPFLLLYIWTEFDATNPIIELLPAAPLVAHTHAAALRHLAKGTKVRTSNGMLRGGIKNRFMGNMNKKQQRVKVPIKQKESWRSSKRSDWCWTTNRSEIGPEINSRVESRFKGKRQGRQKQRACFSESVAPNHFEGSFYSDDLQVCVCWFMETTKKTNEKGTRTQLHHDVGVASLSETARPRNHKETAPTLGE